MLFSNLLGVNETLSVHDDGTLSHGLGFGTSCLVIGLYRDGFLIVASSRLELLPGTWIGSEMGSATRRALFILLLWSKKT